MNRFASANLQSGVLRYKHLTVGDVRPDATTKLYKRMFKGTGRKYIPVKDITSDTMGRELNAYLINPEYIDKSVLDPSVLSRQLEPQTVVRAVQYSKLTYNRPVAINNRRTIQRTAALFSTAVAIGKQAVTATKEMVIRAANTALHSPFGRTYSVRDGMAIHKRQKVLAKASGLVVIASFGIIGLQSMNTQQPIVQPKPVTTSSSSSAENPLTSTGSTTNQPIPIFNNSRRVSMPSSPVIAERTVTSSEVKLEQPITVAPVASQLIAQPKPTSPIMIEGGQGSGNTIVPAPEETIITAPPAVTPEPITDGTVVSTTLETVVDTTTQAVDDVNNVVGHLLGN